MIVPKGFVPYRLISSKPYSLRSIIVFAIIVGLILHLRYSLFTIISEETAYVSKSVTASHPIERLVLQNFRKHQQFLARQSKTPEEAIKAYKKRYRRDPPPGFAKWVRFALAQNSSVIDDYDIIEERIAPFRNIPARDLKRRIKAFQDNADAFETIKIRDGVAIEGSKEFVTSIEAIVDQLPDMDILLNWLDEPRIIGSNPDSNKAVIEDYRAKNSWGVLTEKCKTTSHKRWLSGSNPQVVKPKFVEDPKYELDICAHPAYQTLHGFFTSPSNFRMTRNLVPFLSCTTMSTMHDLLTPGLDYVDWNYLGDPKNGDKIPYAEKQAMVYWKGWSTGSQFTEDSWKDNHRVRFVQRFQKNLLFNVGFSNYVQCDGVCDKMREVIGEVPNDPATAGFAYKFAMDLDGNGYSGRYYRLLQSNCLVFKQTLFEQWHDDRLVPWVHYVPVSMNMDELEAAVTYFSEDPKGQIYGERIAEDGKNWAKKVLRSTDMTIYTYRLLLEYAALFKQEAALID